MALFDEYLANEEIFKRPSLGSEGFFFNRSGNLTGRGRLVSGLLSYGGAMIGGEKGANFAGTLNQGLLSMAKNNNFEGADQAILENVNQGVGQVNADNAIARAGGAIQDQVRSKAKELLSFGTGMTSGTATTQIPSFTGNITDMPSMQPTAGMNLIKPPALRNDVLTEYQKFLEMTGNTNPLRPQMFADGGILEKLKKIQNSGALLDKPVVDFVNMNIKPAIPDLSNVKQDKGTLDISWLKKKNDTVNIENLSPSIKQYLNTIPAALKDSMLVTSANDYAGHAKGSEHYKDNAVDLRFNKNLYNYIINDAVAKQMGITTLNPNHGTAKHIHLQFQNLKNGGIMAKDDAVIYKDGDETEDILMVDKETGGIVGQMRYEERIFDQKASKVMKELALKGNVNKLGKFVKKEIETHKDFTQNFAEGGPVPRKKITWTDVYNFLANPKTPIIPQYPFNTGSSSLNGNVTNSLGPGIPEITNIFRQGQVVQAPATTQPAATGRTGQGRGTGTAGATTKTPTSDEVKQVQQRYNDWIKNSARFTRDANGLSIPNPNYKDGKLYGPDGKAVELDLLKVDGKLGKDTQDALAAYNADPLNEKLLYSVEGNKVQFDQPSLTAFLKDINVKTAARPTPGLPTIGSSFNNNQNTGQLAQNMAENFGLTNGIQAPQTGSTALSQFQSLISGNQNAIANATDYIRAGIATMNAANTDIPVYELPAEYRDLQRNLAARSNQGFSAVEQGAFNDMQQQNRISGEAAIRASVGFGGSSGAVLGALGNLDRNQRSAATNFAVANNQVMQNNFNRNAAFVSNEQQRQYGQEFLPQYEQAVANRNAYTGAAAANIANVQRRNEANMATGPGSTYDRYLNAVANRENVQAQAIQSASTRPLFVQTPDGSVYSSDLNTLLSEADKRRAAQIGVQTK